VDNALAARAKNAAPLRFSFAADRFSAYISRVPERGGDGGDGGVGGFASCRPLNPDLA
jgi:hypothetical protein